MSSRSRICFLLGKKLNKQDRISPYHPQTTSRQMVGRILRWNYVRKWLICYHKWLESSGYIRCYKGWVSCATIIRSIQKYLNSCHQTGWLRIVLAGNQQSINRRVVGILRTYLLMKKNLNGSKVTTKMMLILNVTYLMT